MKGPAGGLSLNKDQPWQGDILTINTEIFLITTQRCSVWTRRLFVDLKELSKALGTISSGQGKGDSYWPWLSA